MLSSVENVAIIGGGLAGLVTALSLHDLSKPCTIYEARSTHSASKTSSGAVMLSPNGMRILDRLGLYPMIKEKSFPFEYVYYKDGDERTLDRYPLGDEATFGYTAFRIYRQELLDILYGACFERGIPVEFSKKFTRVVDETGSEVAFEFADGTTGKASLLIGADGIHSKVRNYICPGVEKKFMGLTALTWETPTKQLRVPKEKDYKFPVSIMSANGVFVLAPQKPDGSSMLSGTQFPIEELEREGQEKLLADKSALVERARKNMDAWPDIVKSSLEDINPETLNLWFFYSIPRLPYWTSEKHQRVLILGDAAHAIPPTTGNGASQAFEDAHALVLLLSALRDNRQTLRWTEAMRFWQEMRQERIDDLLKLTRLLNSKRLPLEKQRLLGEDEVWVDESAANPNQMAWLYGSNIEEGVEEWVDRAPKIGV